MNGRQSEQGTVHDQFTRRLLTRRRMLMAIVLCALVELSLRADEQPPHPGLAEQEPPVAGQNDGLIQTTVQYDKAMLVVVAKEGAAGIRFIDPFELGNKSGNGVVGVTYEWRFLASNPGAEEQTGSGRVFAKLVDGKLRDGLFVVACGPIELTWAFHDKAMGKVRYDPRDLAVHPVEVKHFAARRVGNAPLQLAPIDLHPFLKSDRPARAARAAAPVLYRHGVLVVSDKSGIATFEFGTAFERAKGANQKLHGVPYHFTFVSPEGEAKEGDGEVYETFTNGKYDGQLELEAGPLRIEWSLGGDELGWIYYEPVRKLIWCVDKPYAKQLVDVIAAEAHAGTQ